MRKIQELKENDGMTLVKYKEVLYKKGYQVATEGIECKTPEEAQAAVRAFNGNAGIWYSKGVYYVDRSHHVHSKNDAILIGKLCNQQSILRWEDMSIIWLTGE